MATKNIDKIKNSVFLNTLNEKVNLDNNSIYTPTLKMAWEELKIVLESSIVKSNNNDLVSLDNYKFIQYPLSIQEYEKDIKIDGDKINITVEFNKVLPFEEDLYINKNALIFNNKEVCSFSPKNKWVKLIYFNNEDDFAISITPKDNEHEIVLIKSNFQSELILKDEIEKVINKSSYDSMKYNEEIIIPIIEFDLLSKFPNIRSVQLYTEKYPFLLKGIEQKTKFTLNNKGAEVKSIVRIGGLVNCVSQPPRKMEFNKPFIVYIRKKDSKEPYFAMYLANTNHLKDYSIEYIESSNAEIEKNRPKLSTNGRMPRLRL